MSIRYECEIPDLESFFVRDPEPQVCDWQGRRALRLSGQGPSLLIFPDLHLSQGWIEVDIGSDGAAFPGIAFRLLDILNFELAYVQPHTSGKWDAIQYDPVFHGSNTWQLHFGSGAQQSADTPPKTWFSLRAAFHDQRALIQVGEQKPLIVNRLAHKHHTGLVGLWSYLPAYFSNFRVRDNLPESLASLPLAPIMNPPEGIVTQWFLEGYGLVDTEETGILNLNRYLPVSESTANLIRQVEMPEDGDLRFNLGFSDELTLQIDDQVIFQGENLFHDSPKWEERGYVEPTSQARCHLSKGVHQITAILKAKEYFGFGLVLSIEGDEHKLIPAYFGLINKSL